MGENSKIKEAIKYYKEHKDELKPAIEKSKDFFDHLNAGRITEAEELVTRFASVASLRDKRKAVDELISDRNKVADTISFLGLVVKLFAKGMK